jgi:hypothetical protein
LDLRRETLSETQLSEAAASVFREAESLGCKVDVAGLREALEQLVYERLEAYRANRDAGSAESAIHFLLLAERLGVSLDLWRLQNLLWELLNETKDDAENDSTRDLSERLKFSPSRVRTKGKLRA